jgi:hypothetical protein
MSAMRTLVLTSVALLLASAVVAQAAGFGLKPGLWELHVVRQVIDGQDKTAAVNALAANMQQMMANLPPDQRAKLQGMMKQNGIGGSSGALVQICVTPEMARRDRPIIDPEGRCQPASITHSGNTTTFSYQCSMNGEMTLGKGTAVADGDHIAVSSDLTATGSGGTRHSMHNETEFRFLGSDCGDVKPPASSEAAP